MSILSRALQSTYYYFTGGRREPARIILLGLDASGKTTFIYKVANQSRFYPAEVVTSIPTIGFNVETMEIKTMQFTCWDVGGCDKIRPLWRHYMQNVGALIFFIDSNDRDRLEDAKIELDLFLLEEDLRGRPILIVANKCDLPNAMSKEEITVKLSLHTIRDREWAVLSACVCNGTGVLEILEWLDFSVKKNRAKPVKEVHVPAATSASQEENSDRSTTHASAKLDLTAVLSSSPPVLRSIQEDWMDRVDEPEGEFLTMLNNFQLDIWDHYTHVRIAWVLIKNYGIKEGFSAVETALRAFIENSARTDSRSFHATMTRFWCHMIVYCRELAVWEKNAERHDGFKEFIAALCATDSVVGQHAPLWDKALFKRYYSSHAMFKAEARAEASPPDLEALPDIVAIMSVPVESSNDALHRNDIKFLESASYWKLPN